MANITAESISNAPQPEAPGQTAPPVAPSSVETKAPEQTSSLPPVVSDPVRTADASLVPVAPIETEAEAEKIIVQPEKSGKTASSIIPDVQPAHPKPSEPLVTNGNPKGQPKPVTVEEVQDPELPTAKLTDTNDVAKPEISEEPAVNEPTAAATEEPKDVEMTGISQSESEAPKFSAKSASTEPANAEPEIGDKRKADETSASTSDKASEVEKEVDEAPAEKKQKTNGAATNGAAKKSRRSKKEKKPTPVPGRTARKTRSQGAAE
ncbi:uncharacterized protein BCR38DRAFT_407799 [Pseudomassariella vexata]|uniref:Uncharacterized protein n=1 Tax=Pseudomassariella vexata TaxID=1141098 RepID=A0A1Y2E2L2_9PEZI|nr:uncharacterized protein BCR38DRAFT_407799 [Pseudomassariella vexata]ORY65788.1 hypothetical protein BCR38DRAFT_407799 [Pseudomassariella vexata]